MPQRRQAKQIDEIHPRGIVFQSIGIMLCGFSEKTFVVQGQPAVEPFRFAHNATGQQGNLGHFL